MKDLDRSVVIHSILNLKEWKFFLLHHRQEAVDINLYKAITKDVETPSGEKITCRTYEKVITPDVKYEFEDLPLDRQPSRTYLTVIWKGADESGLPSEYINDLKRIPHNNRDAESSEFRMFSEWNSLVEI